MGKQKISGIGGFFFRAKDPEKISKWYEKNFGIDGINSSQVWMQNAGPTVFAPLPDNTDYFGSSKQHTLLNFRVNDLNAMIQQLQVNGVAVHEKRVEKDYGKFASVYDPEGNKIELWEPSESSSWKEEKK
jgi:glyoxylase I family protein